MRRAPIRPKGLPQFKSKPAAKAKNRLPCASTRRQNAPLEKIPNLWRCDFFDSAQTVTASRQNACAYDGSASGSIIYAYVNGNPIGYIDPDGLFRYSPTAGGPVDAPTAAGLTCFEQCIGGGEITVTAGREGGHSPGSAHETGQACDVGKNSNPGVNRQDAQRCFQQCFDQSHSYGQEEGNHYHFQTRPGVGGATGFAPGVH